MRVSCVTAEPLRSVFNFNIVFCFNIQDDIQSLDKKCWKHCCHFDDDEFESCQLCGHEKVLLDELVQPAATVLCQSTAVCKALTSIWIV